MRYIVKGETCGQSPCAVGVDGQNLGTVVATWSGVPKDSVLASWQRHRIRHDQTMLLLPPVQRIIPAGSIVLQSKWHLASCTWVAQPETPPLSSATRCGGG